MGKPERTLGRPRCRWEDNIKMDMREVLLLGFMTLFNILGHCITYNIEREKSDKFCSEALISAWGSFTCRKSTTQDPRLCFPSEGSHTQDFYALKKSIDPANLGSRGEYDNHWGRLEGSGLWSWRLGGSFWREGPMASLCKGANEPLGPLKAN